MIGKNDEFWGGFEKDSVEAGVTSGVTRGTGSASEDHKSRDYKRPIGKLSFFDS